MALALKFDFPEDEVEIAVCSDCLGHPVRNRVLYQLWVDGPTSFKFLHRLSREKKGSFSFHLKMLYDSKYIDRYQNNGELVYFLMEKNLDLILPILIRYLRKMEQDLSESALFNHISPEKIAKRRNDLKLLQSDLIRDAQLLIAKSGKSVLFKDRLSNLYFDTA
jgi:DNA-binding transcriptional ArsR family regulator